MKRDPLWLVLGVKTSRPSRTGIYKTHGRTPSHQLWFYQAISNTMMMETQLVPETSQNFHTWMRLFAQEHFIDSVTTEVSRLIAVPELNPLAYTDVPETARLARSINTQPAVRRNSETNPTSQHNRGM